MKLIFVIVVLLQPIIGFGQRSPYQKKIARDVFRACRMADFPLTTYGILSVAEVNTDGGTNKFAKINNPFKIECFSKRCKSGHCTNADIKNHKKFYRIYDNVRESCTAYIKLKYK